MKTTLGISTVCFALLTMGATHTAWSYTPNAVANMPTNALTMARQNPNLSIMVEAIEAAGFASVLSFAGSDYTIFAPSNAAFESLFRETTLDKQTLMSNKSILRVLLSYHVVKSKQPLFTNNLQTGSLTTLNKRSLAVTSKSTIMDMRGRSAHIVTPNIATKNGVVHVIDRVMVPK